ncbi:MAG: aryl-sulfate sulfotransferase [Saprospiraceae bacterium]|nr:aryl-sulfate sulfotransferase [Saprospiraceae bacterium]
MGGSNTGLRNIQHPGFIKDISHQSRWPGSTYRDSKFGPSGGFYLQPDGYLIRSGRDPDAPVFGGGGQGGYFQKFNWTGDLVWEYRFATEKHLSHHDMAVMPNGNILAIAWEAKSVDEALLSGRKPDMIPKAGLWPDMVVEIKPEGSDEGQIVWEWHLWDHMIQNFDTAKKNYGDPSMHPELMDINIGRPLPIPPTIEELNKERSENNAVTNATPENRGSDAFHMNAIDYNAELDQIVLSSPSKGEIYIIDHSTTTEEAAGHSGGKQGKGGDLLYRWGNPENYGRGDSTDQQLGGQHDIRWIPNGMPGEGNLIVFNNSVPNAKPPYSAIYEFTPPRDMEGNYLVENKKAFGPENPSWTYIAKDTLSFWSPFISGVHRLANGNTFITEGAKGRYTEVNVAGEILWDYLTPFTDTLKMSDGTGPQPTGDLIYATFRASHIEAHHPALAGKELKPLDPQPEVFVVPEKTQE